MNLIIYRDGEFVSADKGVKFNIEDEIPLSGIVLESKYFTHVSETVYPNSVFESLRTYYGKIYRFEEHLDRLIKSANMIQLIPPISSDEMKKAIYTTIAKNGLEADDVYIRVSLTKSSNCVTSRQLASIEILTKKLPKYPDEIIKKGVSVVTVSNRKNLIEALTPQIKSSNFLSNILARIEANQHQNQLPNIAPLFEAIMLNEKGFLAEGTISNVFLIKNGVVLTPHLCSGVLEGITRSVIIALAKLEGILIKEDMLTRFDLYTADEAFLTFTSIGILPIIEVDSRIIEDNSHKKITERLISAYKKDTCSSISLI